MKVGPIAEVAYPVEIQLLGLIILGFVGLHIHEDCYHSHQIAALIRVRSVF